MTSIKVGARTHARRLLDTITSPIGSVLRFRDIGQRICLTFDDGPDPEVTPRLLKVLEEADASATFFMLNTRVRLYPEIAKLVAESSNEIALHGLDHRRLTSLTSAQAAQSITRGKSEIEQMLGVQIRWFRPPYGAHNLNTWRAARSLGLQSVLWGPSLHDWTEMPLDQRLRGASARPGDIILGHDGLAGPGDGAMNEPVPPDLDRAEWAQEILRRYRSRGLSSITLSDADRRGNTVRGVRWTK